MAEPIYLQLESSELFWEPKLQYVICEGNFCCLFYLANSAMASNDELGGAGVCSNCCTSKPSPEFARVTASRVLPTLGEGLYQNHLESSKQPCRVGGDASLVLQMRTLNCQGSVMCVLGRRAAPGPLPPGRRLPSLKQCARV